MIIRRLRPLGTGSKTGPVKICRGDYAISRVYTGSTRGRQLTLFVCNNVGPGLSPQPPSADNSFLLDSRLAEMLLDNLPRDEMIKAMKNCVFFHTYFHYMPPLKRYKVITVCIGFISGMINRKYISFKYFTLKIISNIFPVKYENHLSVRCSPSLT